MLTIREVPNLTASDTNHQTLVSLHHVSKSYGKQAILWDVTISINAGETVSIVGPNGSGKSTLLRLIGELSTVTDGVRMVHVEDLRIGYVPDRFPKLRFTPFEYLTDMGRIQKILEVELVSRVNELLDMLNLQHAQHRRMTGFSKGMLQKVNLMQALLSRPQLLLLDEPFSGLDQVSQQQLLDHLRSLKYQGLAMVIICHEPALVDPLANRAITIDHGEIRSLERAPISRQAEVVVIEAVFDPASVILDVAELRHRLAGIEHLERIDEICTLYVPAQMSNSVLRELLDMGAGIQSLQRRPAHATQPTMAGWEAADSASASSPASRVLGQLSPSCIRSFSIVSPSPSPVANSSSRASQRYPSRYSGLASASTSMNTGSEREVTRFLV